jgi:ribonucleoside-diphosphate reductase beta chain
MRLDPTSLPLRDYHKAKRLAWNPQDIDFAQDAKDYAAMTVEEQALIRTALVLFIGGEASVTHNLAPLMIALKKQGGTLEEEMFLTTQLFEEAKHVEFFDAVIGAIGLAEFDPLALAGEQYRLLFQALDQAMGALISDQSRMAQANAIVTYHMIVEGVLAETGYYGFFTALRAKGLMPGLTQGLEYLQRDEARHIAFGLHLLTRMIRAEPALWTIIEAQLSELMGLATGVYMELLSEFLPELPFNLDLGDILAYAGRQYQARIGVLQRARTPELATT